MDKPIILQKILIMKSAYIFIFLAIITLNSCSQTVDILEVESRDGITYLKKSNKPFKGTVISWYSPGNKFSVSEYDKGLLNGKQTTYYANGQVQSIITYLDFYMNGPYVFYYKNGHIKEKGNFIHCMEDGLWSYFYENGEKSLFNPGVLNFFVKFCRIFSVFHARLIK